MDIYICSGTLEQLDRLKESVFAGLSNDPNLISVLNKHAKEISKKEEIFHQEKNILVTERCYYMTFFGEQLERITE